MTCIAGGAGDDDDHYPRSPSITAGASLQGSLPRPRRGGQAGVSRSSRPSASGCDGRRGKAALNRTRGSALLMSAAYAGGNAAYGFDALPVSDYRCR